MIQFFFFFSHIFFFKLCQCNNLAKKSLFYVFYLYLHAFYRSIDAIGPNFHPRFFFKNTFTTFSMTFLKKYHLQKENIIIFYLHRLIFFLKGGKDKKKRWKIVTISESIYKTILVKGREKGQGWEIIES